MIVLDASAAIELLLRSPVGVAVAARFAADAGRPQAPHLLDAEVAQAFRRLVAAGHLGATRGRQALEDLATLPVERRAHRPLLGRAWELRANLTIYDGLYVALAESLGATLVTTDARLAAAPGTRARVEVIAAAR